MYLIGFSNGHSRCGNSGSMITHYTANWRIRRLAEDWAHMTGNDTVYGIRVYPLELSQMTKDEDFLNYIQHHGLCLYRKEGIK